MEWAAHRRSHTQGVRQRLDRGLQLVRTYPPTQIAERLFKTFKRKAGLRYVPANPPGDVQVGDYTRFARLFAATAPWQNHRSADLATGQVTLLNETQPLGYPFDWRCGKSPRPSHLWRFQLHYHEYLLNLVKNTDESAPQPFASHWDLAWEIISHWIEQNAPADRQVDADAWHPYCISRRAPVWMKLLAGSRPANADRIELSLFDQVDSLSRNLETDLRGNHLLENLHALAMAGCFFEGSRARRWREQARRLLQRELAFQVLPSGEHYERSPMYHCVVLANLLQLAYVAGDLDSPLRDLVQSHAQRMLDLLVNIICPDGEIPLLADSCFDEAPSVGQILEFAELAGVEPNPDHQCGSSVTGEYWVHQTDRDWFLLDAGPVAATGLPGHAHCDLLNVVGSIRGQRFLVDSGNGSYDLDSTRSYCRSSVAHNVLTADQMDHCDVWSKFRMGHQGRVTGFRSGSRGPFDWVRASHDAYRRIGLPEIVRWVACHRDRLCWVCLDCLSGDSRHHTLQGFLHFDESVRLSAIDQHRWLARTDTGDYQVGFVGCQKIQLARGQVCQAFGQCVEAPAMVYSGAIPESRVLGWYVVPADADILVQLASPSDPPSVTITLDQQPTEFKIDKL